MKLFQLATSASTETVASAGRAIGSRIRQKKPNALQPSSVAASSISPGIARKNAAQDDDRHRQPERGLRQDHAERVVQQAEGAQQDEQRQDRHREREHQPDGEEREQQLPAPEGEPGEDERGQRRRADDQERGGHRDERAVGERPPEVRRGEDVGVVGDPHGDGSPNGLVDSWPLSLNPPSTPKSERHDDERADHRDDRVQHDASAATPRTRAAAHRWSRIPVIAPSVSRRRTKRW